MAETGEKLAVENKRKKRTPLLNIRLSWGSANRCVVTRDNLLQKKRSDVAFPARHRSDMPRKLDTEKAFNSSRSNCSLFYLTFFFFSRLLFGWLLSYAVLNFDLDSDMDRERGCWKLDLNFRERVDIIFISFF